MLYIVATPIGNLEDITLRALRILKEVDVVIAEDTRHSGILLNKYEIKTPLTSFHSHSNEGEVNRLVALLSGGKNAALISDAGTPGISDPGYVLIQRALAAGIAMTVIPGPSAVITGIVASGLPMHRFLYLGFLPLKKGRKTLIASLREVPYTVALYEAPHRIARTLRELHAALGDRAVAVCREMTKVFEEVFRGTLSAAAAHFEKKKPRGEFTVVIGPHDKSSGFTLGELMVVISIVMILSAVAISSTRGILQNLNFNNTFNKGVFMAQQARSLAVTGADSTKTGYGVQFDASGIKSYSTTEDTTSASTCTTPTHTILETYALPASTALKYTSTPNAVATPCDCAMITFFHGQSTAKLTCEGGGNISMPDSLKITLQGVGPGAEKSKSFSIHRAAGVPQVE